MIGHGCPLHTSNPVGPTDSSPPIEAQLTPCASCRTPALPSQAHLAKGSCHEPLSSIGCVPALGRWAFSRAQSRQESPIRLVVSKLLRYTPEWFLIVPPAWPQVKGRNPHASPKRPKWALSTVMTSPKSFLLASPTLISCLDWR